MTAAEFVLGIDGGGSKTVAWLSPVESVDEKVPIGRGEAGASNPQSVGWEVALENLEQAADAAFADAGMMPGTVESACVALAGGDRDDVRIRLQEWCQRRGLARHFLPTHDASPLLAAGTPDGTGIAIVSGTGSFAFGQSTDERIVRAGGWGYLFGDEGSGYSIALAGLRAAAKAFDGRGDATQLCDRFLQQLGLQKPDELINSIYSRSNDRRRLASLAETVCIAADDNDSVASEIIQNEVKELVQMTSAVARNLQFDDDRFPLALGGGVLIHSTSLRELFLDRLVDSGLHPEPAAVVTEPIAGAVILARSFLTANDKSPGERQA
jgi:N-acetylmuramic acid 6-phosphate etherase